MHHRRKQRFSEGSCRQYAIDNEEPTLEATVSADPDNRTDKDSSIVISDSDDAELQEESILPKKRRRPPLHRKPLSVRRKISHMTEEEQLALAVKISQQEQKRPEEYTQDEEDELIKKAIEESLHGCQVPNIPISVTKDELPNETSVGKEQHFSLNDQIEGPNLSEGAKVSSEDATKSPVVLLQRLSQDIVESSSVILSPNCKDPISCIEECLQSPPSPCTSSDFIKLSPAIGLALSPVFPKKSPCSRKLIPCRLFQERSLSADRLVDDLDDQRTHCSESPQIDSSAVLPLSQGEISYQRDFSDTKNLCTDKANKIDCGDTSSVASLEKLDCRSDKPNQGGGMVHYYWGVPFCPKGVDPSEYTKVILCQFEVYQKSLKSAQRQLLHKMDYGQPIHLAASSQENDQENSQDNRSHEDTEDGVAEDNPATPEGGEKAHDDSDSQETQQISSKRQKISQSPVETVLENDHCSLSQGDTNNMKIAKQSCLEVGKGFPTRQQQEEPVLLQQTALPKLLPSERTGAAPAAPGESAVSPTAVRNDRHLMEHTEIAQEEEITICPETQPSPIKQEESENEDQTDEMGIAPEPQACASANSSDEELVCLDKVVNKNVPCPICGCNFPRNQIERHAAYCDGTNGQQEMTVLRSRNKLRKSDKSSTVSITSADSGKCEKCYLCKSLVPLKDYQAHVDRCLQTAVLETQGSQRLRSIKQEYSGHNGRLLSMLEQSESSLAEESTNAPEPSTLSPPREEHGDGFNPEHLDLSDSPIRSFVSISEATDCLVDFKKQFSHHSSSRRVSRRGKRRRI